MIKKLTPLKKLTQYINSVKQEFDTQLKCSYLIE